MKKGPTVVIAVFLRLVIAAVVALFALNIRAVHAGSNTWTQIGPSGGTIASVAYDPSTPSTLYAATLDGFYRSTNAGESWQKTTLPSLIEFDYLMEIASDSRNVFVVTAGGGIYASVDKGVSFKLVQPSTKSAGATQKSTQNIKIASDGTVYFPLGLDLYRSNDQGATWTLRGTVPGPVSPYSISNIHVDPTNSNVVYVCVFSYGVFRTDDGGVTWSPLLIRNGSTVRNNPHRISVDPSNPSVVWLATDTGLLVSRDRGSTWQNTSLTSYLWDVDVHPTNSQIVYAIDDANKLLQTKDGGVTWTPIRFSGGRLSIDSGNPSRMFLIGGGHLSVTDDAGTNWRTIDSGIFASSPIGFHGTSSGRILTPVNYQGIYAISPDGKTTTLIPDTFIPNPMLSLAYLSGSDPPDVLQVVSFDGQPEKLLVRLGNNKIARNETAGGPWLAPSAPIPASAIITAIAASTRGGQSAYAATTEGIFRSNDFGDHWIAGNSGVPAGARVTAVATTIDSNLLFSVVVTSDASKTTSTVYKSVDSGATWFATQLTWPSLDNSYSYVLNFEYQLHASPFDSRTIFVTGMGGALYKSTDSGLTWATLQASSGPNNCCVNDIAFDPTNPSIVYKAGDVFAYRSIDGGTSFQAMTRENIRPHAVFVNPKQPNQVFVALQYKGIMEMTVEPDLEVTPGQAAYTVTPGATVTVPIFVANKSVLDAINVRLEVQVSGQFNDLRPSTTTGSCTASGGTATCQFALLRNGTNGSVQLQMAAPASGSIQISANTSSDLPDAAPSNNATSATVTIKEADSGGKGGGGAMTTWLLLLLFAVAVVTYAGAERRRLNRSENGAGHQVRGGVFKLPAAPKL